MTPYTNLQTAKRDFLYFDGKYQKVLRCFSLFIEQVIPEVQRIDGLKITLNTDYHLVTVDCYGRRFVAEIAGVVKGDDVQGHVDFSEVFEGRRRKVDSFIVTTGGNFSESSGKEIGAVSDWSDAQSIFFLNLIHLGLSHPPERAATAI